VGNFKLTTLVDHVPPTIPTHDQDSPFLEDEAPSPSDHDAELSIQAIPGT
jgi:hypothetical protein